MRVNSLAFRLFVSSAAWTLLVLPLTAVALVSMYRGAMERNFDERLHQHVVSLIANSSPEGGVDLRQPVGLEQPLFTLPFSGWYWQIKPLAGNARILKSDSLVTETLKLPSEMGVGPDAEELRKAYVMGPNDQPLRIVELHVVHADGEARGAYSYAVAITSTEVSKDVVDFTVNLIVAFSVLGAGLLLATFFQVRFGLMPLRDISARLAAIRSGEAARLEGELPDEINPLQRELNALIQSNHDIVERSRTHVGNLAHALKTPLSVITNEARGRPEQFAAKIAEQASLMGEHITHHLARAQAAARAGAVGGVTVIRPALDAVVNALQRIYSEQELRFAFECAADVKFRGEKTDFQEMVGNLLDNACKWARSTVWLRVALENRAGRPAAGDGGRVIVLLIDDDGPGLTVEERAAGAKRGRRLDESKPGTGLGLAIVVDLAHLYNGTCALERAPSGGLRARLELPAV